MIWSSASFNFAIWLPRLGYHNTFSFFSVIIYLDILQTCMVSLTPPSHCHKLGHPPSVLTAWTAASCKLISKYGVNSADGTKTKQSNHSPTFNLPLYYCLHSFVGEAIFRLRMIHICVSMHRLGLTARWNVYIYESVRVQWLAQRHFCGKRHQSTCQNQWQLPTEGPG